MLGQHPHLYGLPELRLFRARCIGDLLINPSPENGMPAQERVAGLARALAELHEGCQSADAVTRAWRWLEHHANRDVASVFDHILERIAPLVGVEKSPETSLSDEALACCAERSKGKTRVM